METRQVTQNFTKLELRTFFWRPFFRLEKKSKLLEEEINIIGITSFFERAYNLTI